jgi:hypothetical protein
MKSGFMMIIAFLSQVFDPVTTHLKKGAKGLDFGSGPGPTLSLMFEKQGYQVDLFDKFYADNPEVLLISQLI